MTLQSDNDVYYSTI